MAQNHVVVYAFGDQTFDATGLLSILLRWDDALLSDLAERTTRRLQQEVAELEPEQRAESPEFASLIDLMPYLRAGTLIPALSQALTCFAQIGAIVASHGYEPGSKPFPTSSTACLTGVCTGLLSAAAVGHSTNVGELVILGEEAIAVAFRVGALAANVGSRIASCKEASGAYSSWTAAIVGSNVNDIRKQVDGFDKQISSTPYISALVSANQVNISAAPQNLHDFLSTLPASGCSSARLPVHAPYHAPHLYYDSDIEEVIRPVTISQAIRASQIGLEVAKTCTPTISSATGRIVTADTFIRALRSAATDCLLHVVRYDLLAPAIASHIRSINEFSELTIQPVALGGPERLELAVRANLDTACGFRDVESIETFLERLQQWQQRPNKASRSKIAVLSCAGRFPRAANMDLFWDVLLNGIDTHEQVPISRWDACTHVSTSPIRKNVSRTGYGCWLEDAAAFDAKFFNVSPREAPQMDPAQRIALMCATEALEEAGIVPGRTPSTQHHRIGVYFGVTSNDWMETNSAQNIDTYFIPGGNRAFIAGRVNYHFKFSGPSYSIDTACSSSLTAIQLACNALWRKEIDMAVVGGTNILTNPDMHCGLDKGHFLSRNGNCKTFDASADGYCRGEAVAVVVLKRLEDAIPTQSRPVFFPWLPITLQKRTLSPARMWVLNENSSIACFEMLECLVAVSAMLKCTAQEHRQVSLELWQHSADFLIPQAGDVAETNSVIGSLAPPGARSLREPLYIGSAKANVGHGEAAAGITSLAKVLLMLKHNTVPPHCGITTDINPKMPNLRSRNTLIASERVHWARPEGGVRRVLVNNFSAAGGNTALILEDPPLRPVIFSPYTKSDHTIVISAKTTVSLHRNVQAMIGWIDQQDISNVYLLPRLAYTTTVRRMHHPQRLAVTSTDLEDIKHQLQLSLDQVGANRRKNPPKILFAFAGQGSEFPHIAVDLYHNVLCFRRDIEAYDRMCLTMGFPHIMSLFRSNDSQHIATPQVLQLAAVCLQMALVRMWRSFGVQPSIVVGHSLGEYPALYAAGVLSQCDVIYLVGKRAALMQEYCMAGSHAMLVVRSSPTSIEALLQSFGYRYEVACINGRRNVVLGGTKSELKLVRTTLEEQGVQTAELPLPYAFHTSQVDPILDALDTLSSNVHFAKQRFPVISPTLAGIPSDFSSAFAVAHCRKAVHMHDALETAQAQGFINEQTICIEIGTAAVTSKMVKEVTGLSTETFVSMQYGEPVSRPLSLALARLYEKGSAIEWHAYHQGFSLCPQIIPLPAYQWDLQDFWITYMNDWSLRKGDAIAPLRNSVLQSTTIHRLVVDTLNSSSGELIVESDLGREDITAVVHGHKVYGIPLCTPSVYADIALTIGQHLKQYILIKTTATVEIIDMDIQSALVVIVGGKSQILRTVVTLDRMNKTALCTFSSVTDSVRGPEQHAHCTLHFLDRDTPCNLEERPLLNVLPRIEALYKQIEASPSNETYRFSRSMIYKMVGAVAEFDDDYRGLAEIVMDNHAFEAAGLIEFKNSQPLGGDFNIHPALIDALSQLGGFVMNANEGTDLNSEIFVNHGWHSFQVFNSIDPNKPYRSHVKMTEGSNKLWSGDVTIFSGEQLVARFGGIALQRVPRRLMEHIVNAAYTRAAAACGIAEPDRLTTVSRTLRIEELAPRVNNEVTSFDAVLAIISSESGIPHQELTDARSFDDLGVDSLLSLLITSRIRDELAIVFENSIFLKLGSVGALRAYITGLDLPSRAEYLAAINEPASPPARIIWNSVLDIVSQEAGIPTQDLSDRSNITDLGVDSLLALIISSRLQKELGIDLPHSSLFVDCDTIGDLRTRITGLSSTSDNDSDDTCSVSVPNSSSSKSSWPVSEASPPETPFTPMDTLINFESYNDKAEKHSARSYFIQGNTKTATQRLFLFPDGGGSATSYMNLPLISPTWAVIAFDSPFVSNPQLMETSSLAALLEIYLIALRQHQPHGPYHLGGWSAGGVLAYALASKLLAANEQVSTLILIDSPSPAHGLDRLPQSFFDHCSKIGIFESEMVVPSTSIPVLPEWLIPHFHATIELLHHYHALPLPQPIEGTGSGTSVTIIWAETCAFDEQKYPELPHDTSCSPAEIEGIRFLTQRRTDFGPGKWAQLFPPGHEVKVHTIKSEHHFSMMKRGAAEVSSVIRIALSRR